LTLIVCFETPALGKLAPSFDETIYYVGHAVKLLGNLAPLHEVFKAQHETLKERFEDLSSAEGE
jgi:hypothetical protein